MNAIAQTFAGRITLIALFVPTTIVASQLSNFNARVAEAFQHQRAATFYVRTGNPDVATFELQRMLTKWQSLLKKFANSPPDAFADDPMWDQSLRRVSENLDAALAATREGHLQAAKYALSQMQREMAALRKRNSVRSFADNIDELNTVIDKLGGFLRPAPDLASIEQVNAIKNVAAVVAYLAARCQDEAPPQYRTNEEFRKLVQDILRATDDLVKSVDGKDQHATTGHIRIIRSHGQVLLLRFG